MLDNESFESVLYVLSAEIRGILLKMSPIVRGNVDEIRLRVNLPLALTVAGDTVFVNKNGRTAFGIEPDLYCVSKNDIEYCFKNLCAGSVYAHEKELQEGFVVMKNGCRAGVFGTLNASGFMSDVTSVNLRIARQVKGCANEIVRNMGFGGLLIAGPPGSGKTTVLRDLIRQISNGENGKLQRVAVIDNRGEISGVYGGKPQNDLGNNTDVLFTQSKKKGVEIAIRTMFPDFVAFDEIGSVEEYESVVSSFYAGVRVITTAHVGSFSELRNRNITAKLISSGVVSQVALLPSLHGNTIKIFSAKELNRNAVI